jgi:aminoglycoside phosphotransferase (APT) family kinase protein
MTVEATDPPGLRMGPLATWLGAHDVPIDVGAPLTAQLFPGGRSNVTYRITDHLGNSVVLRRPPLGNVLPSAHDMAREFRVLRGMNLIDFPAPIAYGLSEDHDVIGSSFMVMSFVDGRVISDAQGAAGLTDDEADAISASLISTLVRLHHIDIERAGLSELGRPQGYLVRQLDRWSKQWDLTRTRELPAIDELHAHLASILPALPDNMPAALVHGDFRLDNSVLAADSSEVLAVLDWEMSTLGDPLSDLALTLLYWTRPDDNLRRLVPIAPGVTERPGFWGRARIIESYGEQSGLPMDHLDARTALACFKLAVIAESIHARTLGGQQLGTAVSNGEDMGGSTEFVAELGLNVIRLGTVAGLAS